MYTCPDCRSHQVTVKRQTVLIEHWNGEEVEYEEDDSYERGPEDATAECDNCGSETYDASEWWTPF